VIRFLQGSVVTQTVLGGITIYQPVINFLQCTVYLNLLRVDIVIAMKKR